MIRNQQAVFKKFNLKSDIQPAQQKARPNPVQFQELLLKVTNYFQKGRYIENLKYTSENRFVSPAVITSREDETVEIVLDYTFFIEIFTRRRPQRPNMEDVVITKSSQISKQEGNEMCISTIDLEYEYKNLKLYNGTIIHWVYSHSMVNF